MNRNLLYAVACLALLFVVSCESNSQWQINGKLASESFKDVKTAYLYTVGEDYLEAELIDSAPVQATRFSFKRQNPIGTPVAFAILLYKGNAYNYHVLIKNGETVNIEINDVPLETKYSGTPLQEELMAYQAISKKDSDYSQSKTQEYQSLTTQDTAAIKNFMTDYQKQAEAFEREKINLISQMKSPELAAFVAGREVSFAGNPTKPFIHKFLEILPNEAKQTAYGKNIQYIYDHFDVYSLWTTTNSIDIDLKSTKELYEALSDADKKTSFGVKISEKIQNLSRLDIGNPLVDFSATTVDGNPFKLSEVKDKIIILDFWASWCAPCRVQNPEYIKLYKRYHDKGLEIVGYSLDTEKGRWVKAIKDDQLPWIQVSNLKDFDDPVLDMYNHISAIPANFVIVDGTIAAIDLFGDDLNKFVKDHL